MNDPMIISFVFGIITIIINIITINNAVNRGNIENARQAGEMLESIRGLRRDIDSFKMTVQNQQTTITALDMRVTKAEEHIKNDYEAIYGEIKPAIAELREKVK